MESNYEKLIPCKRTKTAYRMSVMLSTESVILGSGCGSLGALEKHPPGIFVRRVEEPAQSLMLRQIELPQIEGPLLTREDQADEHNLDYIDKLELLVHQDLDAAVQSPLLCCPTTGPSLSRT